MAMRDDIKKAIEAGGATKESLLELTGTTEKGLASQFTYMRMMGNCPQKQEDGTFKLVSAAEWDAHKASSGSGPTINLTPAERVARAEKRSERALSAYDNAKKRYEANGEDRLTELKFVKAEAELEISEIELGAAEALLAEGGEDTDVDVDEDVINDEELGPDVDPDDLA